MQSLKSTSSYYYLYNNFDLNNEKNNMNFKMKNIYLLNNKKLNYDFYLIYNKQDSELVHNLIAPILKAKPYYYAIALQHNCPNFNATANYLDYIKASSFVVFIISKHLLTEFEYKLVCKTPKYKRIAILIDNINENIVKKLIKPKKIIKWQFFNFNENLDENSFLKCLNNEKLFPFVDSADEI